MADRVNPIIVKKVVKGEEGHHGGAWKVAYADFVTAMMAFFLLMWLLNATTERQRKGLADFFEPTIPISKVSAGGQGMLHGDSVMVPETDAGTRREPASGNGPANAEAAEVTPSEAADRAAAEAAEQARLEALETEIRGIMADVPGLDAHFLVRVTPEGLVIELTDTGGEPLFASGSAQPEPLLRALLQMLVPVLEPVLNPIAIVGHTDARPLDRAGYTNWELSTDRANAARRLLLEAGLDIARVARVSGRAATEPLDGDPYAAPNRRIGITLLRLPPR
ncbi:MAG: flagellar motor protein MotB [Paracoccaceae bacterium]